jgi:hypothetical protein
MDDIASAILKVLDQREALREWEFHSDREARDD